MPGIDRNLAHFNMVEQQIRPWDVMDVGVLNVLTNVPREHFVPHRYYNLAFADLEIPIPHGEKMMKPIIVGRVLQALAVRPSDMVLEVGTGTGYVTALLSRLAKHVYSVDRHGDFVDEAKQRLTTLGFQNATIEQGDAVAGWDRHGPYDAIVLTGSVPEIPATLLSSLRPGGRLFAVVGYLPVMTARLVTRVKNAYPHEDIFETVLPPLVSTMPLQRFLF